MTEPAVEAPAPAPAKRGYLLPGTIALVVIGTIAAIVGVLGLSSYNPTTLPGPVVAQKIAFDLQHGADPPTVRCPTSEPVRRGLVFYCTLLRSGKPPVRLKVTEGGHADFSVTPPTSG